MSASYQKGEAVAVNLCTCSFCSSLAGNASFFADNPAAFTEPSSFGDAPFADLAAAISMVANTPIFLTGSLPTAASTDIGAVSTGAAAVPSWVTGLASTLSFGNTKLTARQFDDLKTIAANLNNGMTASPISCR